MTRLTFSIACPRDPRCPACGHHLTQDVLHFRHATAFCSTCANTSQSGVQTAVLLVVDDRVHRRHPAEWYTERGFFFWCPPVYAPHSSYLIRLQDLDCVHASPEE